MSAEMNTENASDEASRATPSQLAMIERYRNEMHHFIDEQFNRLLYRAITQREGRDMIDSIVPLRGNTSVLKGQKPVSVILANGTEVAISTWKLAAAEILREIDKDPAMHEQLMSLRDRLAGRQRVILGSDPNRMNVPVEISEGLYFEGKFDTEALFHHLKRICGYVGYQDGGILIRYQDAGQVQEANAEEPISCDHQNYEMQM